MTEIEAKGRAFELAEDHWDYIESLLYAHNIPVKELDIAKFANKTEVFDLNWLLISTSLI
jgi:hypothetical protein